MSHEARLPGYTTYKVPATRAKIAALYRDHGLSRSVLRERFPGLTDELIQAILKEHNVPLRKTGRTYLAAGGPV